MTPIHDTRWSPVLAGLRSRELDCLQANLAVLADDLHGPGTHARLGAAGRFEPRFDGELPIADPGLDGRLRQSTAAGLRIVTRETVDGTTLPGSVEPVYVVADAYAMPWLPYFGTKHIEHSFLLAGGCVVDAYDIDTPSGAARPGVWRLPAEDLRAVLAVPVEAIRFEAGPFEPVEVEPCPVDAVNTYVDAYRDHADRGLALETLAAETWMLAREVRLAGAPDAPDWDRLAEEVYMAGRRVERGRGEPTGWVEHLRTLLSAWRLGATGLVGSAVPGADGNSADDQVRAELGTALCAVLGVDAATVDRAGNLADLPGFGSFRLIEVIERVESRLAVQLAPETFTAENLHDRGRLEALFTAALRARPGAAADA